MQALAYAPASTAPVAPRQYLSAASGQADPPRTAQAVLPAPGAMARGEPATEINSVARQGAQGQDNLKILDPSASNRVPPPTRLPAPWPITSANASSCCRARNWGRARATRFSHVPPVPGALPDMGVDLPRGISSRPSGLGSARSFARAADGDHKAHGRPGYRDRHLNPRLDAHDICVQNRTHRHAALTAFALPDVLTLQPRPVANARTHTPGSP